MVDLQYNPVSYGVPVPSTKPDVTGGDVSFLDRVFNTVTNVFEGVADIEFQKYAFDRLGFQSSGWESQAANNTQQLSGQQQTASAANQQMILYVAAAGLFGLGLILAIKK